MNTQNYLSEETMIHRAVEALMTALGPVETARFLNLPRQRYRDYVVWHREWQETLDTDRFLDEVFGTADRTEDRS